MGIVVNLKAFRKTKVPKVIIKTENDEFAMFSEGLVSQWRFQESQNNINRFIADKLQIEQQDFVHDRNAVASLEEDSNITVCISSPTYSDKNADGWIASFAFGDQTYSSIELESETKARLFCVLLYHALMEAASNSSPHVL